MEENICRLCLNLVKKEFEIIDAVTRRMLKIVFSKADLNASENPVLCRNCAENTRKFYYFRSACSNTEEHVYFSTAKEKTEFDIEDVNLNSKDASIGEDFSICRFCKNHIARINSVSIDNLINDVMYLEILPLFIPKTVHSVIKDPVICTHCIENLEDYMKFRQNCLDTEEKLNKYRQTEVIGIASQIKLSNVLRFLFKVDILADPDDCSCAATIKQESAFDYTEQAVDSEIYDNAIKCEEAVDINDEDSCISRLHESGKCTCKTKSKSAPNENATHINIHKCGECTFETKYKFNLNKHMLTVHKDTSELEMHKCETCTFETKYKKSLKRHVLTHKDTSEEEYYKCGKCAYFSKYKRHLKKHMLAHLYKCDICIYVTTHPKSLKSHILMHKDTAEVEMYKCGLCTFQTRHKMGVKIHMQIHKNASDHKNLKEIPQSQHNLENALK